MLEILAQHPLGVKINLAKSSEMAELELSSKCLLPSCSNSGSLKTETVKRYKQSNNLLNVQLRGVMMMRQVLSCGPF